MAVKRINVQKLRATFEQEMRDIATDLLKEAKEQTPIDEGTLRRSAVKEVQWQGERLVVNISFNTPYAAAVHEGDATHVVGKRKYLEDPMRAMKPKMAKRLNEAYRRGLQ